MKNLCRYLILVSVLFGLEIIQEHFAKTFMGLPWQLLISAIAVIFAIFGAISFRLFRGSAVGRLLLVIAIPIAANVLLEIFVGSDAAYPYVILLLAIPYAVAFAVGAMAMAAYQRNRSKPTSVRS